MIRGTVIARREAVVQLSVCGPNGAEARIDAVVDSGFSASLTLPAALVTSLGLVRQSTGRAVLTDGTVRRFDIFEAEVEWDGSWKSILISGVGGDVLLGMRLLADHELRIAVVPGGGVEISALP
ncbi:MAG TPA: hypothetical protein VHR66_30745, partial [Gemmataceae bacterium]|nr:hypothetical protein [Gemmataceae bacterium]